MDSQLTTSQFHEAHKLAPVSSRVAPPKTLILGSDEVHIWRATLDLNASDVQDLWQTLSADERARAEQFHFQKDRERFIVGRGLLRIILGRYLDTKPENLRFCYNPQGKPALAREPGRDGICFNLSHSDGLALYAITRRREVGVDLERIQPDLAVDEIAEHFFSPREIAMLRALPTHMQKEAFFNCWTRKEAYIKARGEGLTLRLDQFAVSLAPGEPAALLDTKDDPQEASRWSLRELVPGPGYVAALAAEGYNWQLRCWDLERQKLEQMTETG
ncbi:MAG: 4'-phosphopantetheinyl transferase family protein [Candidatus Binatia bacterium]